MGIIDGVVFLLLFFSFEETTFPRFLFSSIGTDRNRTVAPTTSGTGKEDLEMSNTKLSHSSTSAELPSSMFPRRTYLKTLTLWVYQSDDTTTYIGTTSNVPFSCGRFLQLLFRGPSSLLDAQLG